MLSDIQMGRSLGTATLEFVGASNTTVTEFSVEVAELFLGSFIHEFAARGSTPLPDISDSDLD